MSKFTKSESLSNFNQLVDEVSGLDPVDIINGYTYNKQVNDLLHYTLVIQPELGTDDPENETYIYLNLVMLASDCSIVCLDSEYSSVEIGYYNGTDKATVFKAYNKLMKVAKSYDLYTTELA